MADDSLPAAGWYADGSTVGVHRWFDGAGWTEYTRPDLAFQPVPVAANGYTSTFGTTVPSRLGLAMSPEDNAARDAAFLQHRIGEACRVRRGAIGYFCSGLAVLVVTGAISLALGGPGDLYIVGAIGGVFLVGRAVRDYGRAVFRGAPRFTVVGWFVAAVGLAASLALFIAVPVEAAQQASQALHKLGG